MSEAPASPSALACPLPWQNGQWRQLLAARGSDHLSHALLLAGIRGVGKRQFAQALAHWLMCERPTNGTPCGECRQCGFNRAGTHPDLKWVAPEQPGRQIRVGQVREVVEFLGHTAQQGGFKITVIEPAEAMNSNAANALLKSLEEPAGQSLLILVTDSSAQLPATIRSRCNELRFPSPDPALSRQWLSVRVGGDELATALLEEVPGQPLTALALADSGVLGRIQQWDCDFLALLAGEVDAVSIAEQWHQYELSDILAWFNRRLAGLIAGKLAGAAAATPWQPLVARGDACSLYRLLDLIQDLNQQLRQGTNPNGQLALENLLLVSCDKFHS